MLCFQSWGLRKVQSFKSPLQPAILKGCRFVQKPEVNDALTYFDILNEEDLAELREDDLDEIPLPAAPVLVMVIRTCNSLTTTCGSLLFGYYYQAIILVYNIMKYIKKYQYIRECTKMT